MQRQVTIDNKKRKLNESNTARINRLERRLSRIAPDKQYYIFHGATPSSASIGYHEYRIDCFPNALLNRVTGDFRIMRVDYVIHWPNQVTEIKSAVIQPMSTLSTGTITETVGDFIDPKEYRVNAERISYTAGALNPLHHKSGANLGHVVKVAEDSSNNVVVERNDTYLFIKFYQAQATNTTIPYYIKVTFSEK